MRAIRSTSGAISFNVSNHFPPIAGSKETKPVILPPGRAMLATKPEPIGLLAFANRDGASCLLQGRDHGRTFANNDIWFQLRQLGCVSPQTVVIAGSPAILNPNVAPFAPTQLLKPVPSYAYQRLCFQIALGGSHQHADAPNPFGLLGACRHRPCSRRAPNHFDEIAPSQT